jgi:hypothetical protein
MNLKLLCKATGCLVSQIVKRQIDKHRVSDQEFLNYCGRLARRLQFLRPFLCVQATRARDAMAPGLFQRACGAGKDGASPWQADYLLLSTAIGWLLSQQPFQNLHSSR